MRRAFIFAAVLPLAAGAADAQACLSVSDGVGGVHLTCPDGRTGFLQDSGAGVVSGMIGTQPYSTPSTNLAPPVGLAGGAPGASFVAPPLSAPQVPQSPPAYALPAVPPLNPASGLTFRQRQVLQEQSPKGPAD